MVKRIVRAQEESVTRLELSLNFNEKLGNSAEAVQRVGIKSGAIGLQLRLQKRKPWSGATSWARTNGPEGLRYLGERRRNACEAKQRPKQRVNGGAY